MNRLVFRFEDRVSFSADCYGRDVAEPFRFLLEKAPVLYPGKRVKHVDLMVYDRLYRSGYRQDRVRFIDVEKLNERLGATEPEPLEPEQEAA